MPIHRVTRARILLSAMIFAAVSNSTFLQASVPGVSRELARARAARISNLRYGLSFAIKEHESTTEGTEELGFDSASAGDLPIDYRDGVLHTAELNGQPISTQIENGHLTVPAVAGHNWLKLTFTSNAAAAGKAITRYEDKDDGSTYFYTLFVPMDASMAFPCFDQPDLKAKFSLTIEHPEHWTVIGNTAPETVDQTHTRFPATDPISTYLFAFAVGPFAAVHGKDAAEPTIFVRKSQLAYAKQEAPQVQQTAASGVRYFSLFFAQPFPFPKYDLVLIPGFPFGGMEHAGETFLNEDGILFRSMPTPSDYFRRNTLVLHETCHQWFGDLVTMRWFDDLWLKEGFAQYMAYKALAYLDPASNPWKHFYEDVKPLAYGIDETQGTTPIYQDIPNLKDAKSAYGAIVYQKAPALLKQLEFRMGGDVFRDGLRIYLKQHAYSNAEWSDLIAAFKAAGGEPAGRNLAEGSHRASDLDAWAAAWIKRRGMPQIDVAWSCSAGKIDRLTLQQHDVLADGFVWPIANNLTLNYDGQQGRPNRMLRADWSTATTDLTQAAGMQCPTFVFANAGDQAYGKFPLDAASEAAAAREIVIKPLNEQDPLLRSMLWGALWDNVRLAKSPPRGFVELALKSLPQETDEPMARVQGDRVATALHSYMSEAARKAAVPHVESILADRMINAAALGTRIVSFRTFVSVAETPGALGQLKDLLVGKLAIPGMILKPLDRWSLIGHLIVMSATDAPAIFAAEKARDQSGEGQKYAYAAQAATPTADMKARYFGQYIHSETIQEDWITQSLRPFNSWNQAALTKDYLPQALDELGAIKQHRKIFFLGAWLGAFIGGQATLENCMQAQAEVRTWLATHTIDPDLRLKILEAADTVDRTVLIRSQYPD
jgi:aminopeptidase N